MNIPKSTELFDESRWRIVTDQTERNGSSSFIVSNSDSQSKLILRANLVPISGEINALVGFAGAEFNFSSPIPYEEDLNFEFEMETLKKFTMTLTFINDKGERYQHDLEVSPESSNYKVNISQFKRTSRGRVLPGNLVTGDSLVTFGFSVLYSRQKTNGNEFEANWKVLNFKI